MTSATQIGGMSRLLALVILSSVSATACISAQKSRDYIFSVTGLVTSEGGTPLPNATVTLQVSGQVYAAVEPVKTERRVADSTGGFVFMHNSYARGVKYTITVHKEGFEPQTVSGNAPPAGHHTIRLKRIGGGAAGSSSGSH